MPYLNSKEIEKYCQGLLNVLDDDTAAEGAFRRAGALIEAVRSAIAPGRESPERTRAFTSALSEAASQGRGSETATVARRRGLVKWFSDIRGYGFITDEDGTEVFVHYSGIRGGGYRFLNDGQRVEFTVVRTERGLQARGVQALS